MYYIKETEIWSCWFLWFKTLHFTLQILICEYFPCKRTFGSTLSLVQWSKIWASIRCVESGWKWLETENVWRLDTRPCECRGATNYPDVISRPPYLGMYLPLLCFKFMLGAGIYTFIWYVLSLQPESAQTPSSHGLRYSYLCKRFGN